MITMACIRSWEACCFKNDLMFWCWGRQSDMTMRLRQHDQKRKQKKNIIGRSIRQGVSDNLIFLFFSHWSNKILCAAYVPLLGKYNITIASAYQSSFHFLIDYLSVQEPLTLTFMGSLSWSKLMFQLSKHIAAKDSIGCFCNVWICSIFTSIFVLFVTFYCPSFAIHYFKLPLCCCSIFTIFTL